MTTDSSPVPPAFAARLGSAHHALALLIVVGVTFSIVPWPTFSTAENLHSLTRPAVWVLLAGLIYMAASLAVHWRWGVLLRRGELIGKGGATLALLGHALVAACSGGVLLLGAESRMLLVSLDRLAATLASVAVMSLLLSAADWVAANRQEKYEQQNTDESMSRCHFHAALGWSMLLIAAALILAAGIMSLEQREVPRGEIETSMHQSSGAILR